MLRRTSVRGSLKVVDLSSCRWTLSVLAAGAGGRRGETGRALLSRSADGPHQVRRGRLGRRQLAASRVGSGERVRRERRSASSSAVQFVPSDGGEADDSSR